MNDDVKKNESMDDLDAQLAALGIFGDDDEEGGYSSDPFASLDFGDDDNDPFANVGSITNDDADPFASLDSFAASAVPAPTPAMSDDDMDLDKQLEMLLMADQSADENFEIKDVSVSPTQTVYDPEVDGMGSVQYVKGAFVKEEERKTKMFADISWGKMVATFLIGVLLIAGGAVTTVLTYNAVQGQQFYIDAVAHFTPIEIPTGVANNANHIFLNERVFIGGEEEGTPLTILRISAAYSGTFIYFEENFNPDDFYILLFNQARNLYARTSFDIISPPYSGTVLKFAPLSHNTLFLTLHLQCKTSGEFARFNYRFTAPPVHGVPVFINHPIHSMGGDVNLPGLVVRHAVFDSASSKVHFSYTPDLHSPGFRFNQDSILTGIALRDRHSIITPLTNEPATIYFDDFGVFVGTATFGSIFSLEERVEVIFQDMRYFQPNPEINVRPEELFRRTYVEQRDNALPVQVGAFTLYLTGMRQDGHLIVLPIRSLDEDNRRRPINIDMELRVDLPGGEYITMPGYVRMSPYGSDVLFDMRSHGGRLRDVDISQYSFVINWVEIDVPSVAVPINVRRFYNMQSMRRHVAELAITEAFSGLLAYKSGETTRNGIVGLSPELLNSAELFDIFSPARFDGRAMYAVTISAGDLLSNYDYVAIVEALWTADEGADLQYFSETFKIIARSSESIWSIVDIEQI